MVASDRGVHRRLGLEQVFGGFLQPRGRVLVGFSMPEGRLWTRNRPVAQATQRGVVTLKAPVVHVELSGEAAGPDDVAQGREEVHFDPDRRPVVHHELANVRSIFPAADVEREFEP